METFFTSDLHIGHHNMIAKGWRPFSSVEEHTETLVENWNNLVASDDLVFVLGDVAMGQIAETLPVVGRLNGRKRLILGNHDRPFPGGKNLDHWYSEYLRFFEEVKCHGHLLIADRMVEMNHFPYSGDHTAEDRYVEHRPVDNGNILMHGHVHETWRVNHEWRQIHVGVDAWDFAPVSLDQVTDLVRSF